jgi:hypothetical protein
MAAGWPAPAAKGRCGPGPLTALPAPPQRSGSTAGCLTAHGSLQEPTSAWRAARACTASRSRRLQMIRQETVRCQFRRELATAVLVPIRSLRAPTPGGSVSPGPQGAQCPAPASCLRPVRRSPPMIHDGRSPPHNMQGQLPRGLADPSAAFPRRELAQATPLPMGAAPLDKTCCLGPRRASSLSTQALATSWSRPMRA